MLYVRQSCFPIIKFIIKVRYIYSKKKKNIHLLHVEIKTRLKTSKQ